MAAEPSRKEAFAKTLLKQLFSAPQEADCIDGYARVINFVAPQVPELEEVQKIRQEITRYQMLAALEQDDQIPEEFYDDAWDSEDMLEGSKPYVRQTQKVGRNDPCPCGSGKKYNKYCGANN